MNFEVTARQDNLIRIESAEIAGVCATLKIIGDEAYLLFMKVPEEHRREGIGKELLEAAEIEASALGATEFICEYTDEAEGFKELLEQKGYNLNETGTIRMVRASEFLFSTALRRAVRKTFPGASAESFETMPMFRRDDVADFLARHGFEMPLRDMDTYDAKLSFASFDSEMEPQAVLLSSLCKDAVVVELLFGPSSESTHFNMTVGQHFVRALEERFLEVNDFEICFYARSEFVLELIKRMLNRRYSVYTTHTVMRSTKELPAEGTLLPERDSGYTDPALWQEEAKELPGQRSISKKAAWLK